DYVSIDLSASVGGKLVEDAQASGISYEVGSGTLLDGLDETLAGMSAGDSTTFTAELAGGDRAGQQADVSVTVHCVKVKELPDLDDEFAQAASEYDTLGEFRAGTRERLESVKRLAQVGQARDRALDAVLSRLDIPLPDRLVESESESRQRSLDEQLERSGTTREDYLEARGITEPDLEADVPADARGSVKASFVLDEMDSAEDLRVEQEELNAYIVEQAYRLGVPPDRLAKEIVDRGQLPMAMAEVLRGKALRLLTERVPVTDEAGRPVDIKAATAEGEDGAQDGGAEGTDGAEARDAGATTDWASRRYAGLSQPALPGIQPAGARTRAARLPAPAGWDPGAATGVRRQRTGRYPGTIEVRASVKVTVSGPVNLGRPPAVMPGRNGCSRRTKMVGSGL